jgi:hypothetical protein
MAQTLRRSLEILTGGQQQKTFKEEAATGKVSVGYFATTEDNAATVIAKIPLQQGEAVRVKAETIALRSTGAESLRGNVEAGLRRPLGSPGNVVVIGTNTSTFQNDSAGTPTLTIVANTTDQTADIVVTGETSKIFLWDVFVEYQIININ